MLVGDELAKKAGKHTPHTGTLMNQEHQPWRVTRQPNLVPDRLTFFQSVTELDLLKQASKQHKAAEQIKNTNTSDARQHTRRVERAQPNDKGDTLASITR